MAFGFRMGVSQSGGGTAKKVYLYKNGEQKVSWESPGSYTADDPMLPATFLNDHISVVNSGSNGCVVGTVLPIDLTDYAALHIITKHNSGSNSLSAFVSNTKYYPTYVARVNTSTSAVYTESVLDVSAITGSKYVSVATPSYNTDNDIKEIWLTKS